jgi:hypothetical protein
MRFPHSKTPCHSKSCVHVQGSRSAVKNVPKSFLVEVAIAIVAVTALAIDTRLVSWLASSQRAGK